MNNNHDNEYIKVYKDGEEVTITPDTVSNTVTDNNDLLDITDILDPDIDELDRCYNDFLDPLQKKLNNLDCDSIANPIYRLIMTNYTKHVGFGIMLYYLKKLLQRQLEELQAEYCAINSQGKDKKRSSIFKMKNKVVAIIATYDAVKDALDYLWSNSSLCNVVPALGSNEPEIARGIKNAQKLEKNLTQFLKGEKNNDDTPYDE